MSGVQGDTRGNRNYRFLLSMSSLFPNRAGGGASIAARIGMAGRALLARARGREIVGHVDEVRGDVLYGWAWRPDDPNCRLTVDVFIGDRFVGQALAHLPRPDLREAGLGDGAYGFELLLAEPAPPDLREVRAFALGRGRVELASPASRGQRTANDDPDAYLRTTFAGALTRSVGPAADNAPQPEGARRRLLLAPASPEGPTNYLQHVATREGLVAADAADLRRRYLLGYARRRGRMRAPLAARDIAFLTEGPEPSSPLLRCRAQEWLGTSMAADDIAAACNWALYDSASLGLEDCLVPDLHRRALATPVDEAQSETYPFSPFMRRFVTQSPAFRALRPDGAKPRERALLALLLFARAMPHMLSYMPPETVARFTEEDALGLSPFDTTLASVFGPIDYSGSDWRADIARAGYDLARHEFMSRRPDGGRLHAAAQPPRGAPVVDVQLIGPFTRRLGISDSCRMLALALQATGRSLRLCDYTLDHPNSPRAADGFALEKPGRAKITILHLNLEETPAAVAYLPDIFDDSRLVAFPYIDLSKPDAVHRLGLRLADEIWAASRFIAGAFAPHAETHLIGAACKPLVSIGRAAARAAAYPGAGAGDFVFLTAGDAFSGAYRKNPLGVVEAFKAAFPDDSGVRLVVKTHSRNRLGDPRERAAWDAIVEAADADARIRILEEIVSDDDMAALIEGADCLVSLHRAEGLGLNLMDAMRLGTPVVATAYSGNLDFCTQETAWLVDYALRPIAPGEYISASDDQTWAEPDLGSAVAAMRAVRSYAEERARKAAAARNLIARDFSVEALAARIAPQLARILGKA